MPVNILEGGLDAAELRIGIVVSRFNGFITEQLLKGALATLEQRGCRSITVVTVPGAWELATAAQSLSAGCDAIVALGAVVRGDTPHFEYVCEGAQQGLMRVSLDEGIPIAFGVLTTDNLQQAMDRAGGVSGNKGSEAAEAAIEMANLGRQLATVQKAIRRNPAQPQEDRL
jgi:6,7-dimethyl-8-ribityllumazine synthase